MLQSRIKEVGENATGFVVYYAEINLFSTKSRVFIDFVESNRNTYTDADLVASNFIDRPLKQVRVYNDGGADFIRIGVNGGQRGGTYIKIKTNSSETLPFVDMQNKLVLDMTLQAYTSNATVRIVGLG